MIAALLRISWISLARDRAAQAMRFALPILFFSIFAIIFGRQGQNVSARVTLAVVDESGTPVSQALTRALAADSALRVVTEAAPTGAAREAARVPLDRAGAEALVRAGDADAGLVLPAGIDTSLMRFDMRGRPVPLLTDPSNPVASAVVTGLLQRAVLRALSSTREGFLVGGYRMDTNFMPARTEVVPVLGESHEGGMIAFYAAGIAVMFLLFSCNAAAGSLLVETESGTLERVLGTRVTMGTLLAAKWLYLTLSGVASIVVMFVWAMLVFHLALVQHLPGFALMTLATAACAAAFGLVLAAACRTREQLGAVSTIVVLTLSAVGGSMFPRFLMPEAMQKLSLIGFNAWALDGYLKVFWREAPLAALLPQLGALAGFTLLFMAVARRLARRWEVG